uniref:Uncharacterized protein n=1 Tax=Candidatus Kentrum sp. MB TaxID=2138164 RepID=A0A450Y0A3_9GAMM|nr:MAG: protein of unknown function (DUF4469) with IG-like fold [Candidatus Kentron sp. MB]VFK34961.1 MAG: protein of unknown function (DUF4469) with IG-like fold [Candidatus Kentron sp. MB]VFK77067.1 MAG: protein of unknown function (DUF4469) with IG-like fold [Candidatus Kentron sp. MB]
MSIQYALFENHLTGDANDYAARVQVTTTAGLEAIARRMAEQGAQVNEADIVAVLTGAVTACESLLLEGERVVFGELCQLFPRIQGVFHGPTDHFDPARHRVDVGANPGHGIRKTVRDKAQVSKMESTKPIPTPLQYVDLGSGETDGRLTPGNIGTIDGYRLKFDPTKAEEGIFLIPTKAGEPDVKAVLVQKNKPGQLVFLIPADISKGDYWLEVRARVQGGSELRSGRLDVLLTVQRKQGPNGEGKAEG